MRKEQTQSEALIFILRSGKRALSYIALKKNPSAKMKRKGHSNDTREVSRINVSRVTEKHYSATKPHKSPLYEFHKLFSINIIHTFTKHFP